MQKRLRQVTFLPSPQGQAVADQAKTGGATASQEEENQENEKPDNHTNYTPPAQPHFSVPLPSVTEPPKDQSGLSGPPPPAQENY